MAGNGKSARFSNVGDGSSHSHLYSSNANAVTYGNYINACGLNHEVGDVVDSRRAPATTDSLTEVEIEGEVPEIEVEKDCRICHLGLESYSQEFGDPITLGCSCKGDLSIAHKNCAKKWFKKRGDRTCEICRSIAQNIHGVNEEMTQTLNDMNINPTETSTPSEETDERSCPGNYFLRCVFVLLILISVISLIFHFNKSSS